MSDHIGASIAVSACGSFWSGMLCWLNENSAAMGAIGIMFSISIGLFAKFSQCKHNQRMSDHKKWERQFAERQFKLRKEELEFNRQFKGT